MPLLSAVARRGVALPTLGDVEAGFEDAPPPCCEPAEDWLAVNVMGLAAAAAALEPATGDAQLAGCGLPAADSLAEVSREAGDAVVLSRLVVCDSEVAAAGLGAEEDCAVACVVPGLDAAGLAFSRNFLLTLSDVNFLAGATDGDEGESTAEVAVAASVAALALGAVTFSPTSSETASAGGRGSCAGTVAAVAAAFDDAGRSSWCAVPLTVVAAAVEDSPFPLRLEGGVDSTAATLPRASPPPSVARCAVDVTSDGATPTLS